MQILLTTPIRTFEGHIIKDGGADLLLRAALLGALSRAGRPDQSFEIKAKHFALGVKIASAKEDAIDLESEEIQLLKELICSTYSSLITGQVGILLEGKQTGIPVL